MLRKVNIETHNANEPDTIPAQILHSRSKVLALFLSIFHLSPDQVNMPSDWNQAKIFPIFKKRDRLKASNYRF